MSKILVVNEDFLGDVIFSTSIADRIKEENPDHDIDYAMRWPQLVALLRNNPNIRKAYWSFNMIRELDEYDEIIKLNKITKEVTPPRQYQTEAGIRDPNDKYKVYISEEADEYAYLMTKEMRRINGKRIIGVQNNWIERAFLYTKEQYERGENKKDIGYGDGKRDLDRVLLTLHDTFNLIPLGMPPGTSQTAPEASNPIFLEAHCAVMKHCDYVIGAEGGIINMAAGVGAKTIVDMSACWMLYGPNGLHVKLDQPMLGPDFYFPDEGHIHLDPYITDDELIEAVKDIVLDE